jgi:hypothetical protein
MSLRYLDLIFCYTVSWNERNIQSFDSQLLLSIRKTQARMLSKAEGT